jgi:uncharacterized protein YneF (UPF0154 family)
LKEFEKHLQKMKNYILAALVALVIAVPGAAIASPLFMDQAVENPEINPQLVEAILKAAAEECAYSYAELNDLYEEGVLTIAKEEDGYFVTDGGGFAISILDDAL